MVGRGKAKTEVGIQRRKCVLWIFPPSTVTESSEIPGWEASMDRNQEGSHILCVVLFATLPTPTLPPPPTPTPLRKLQPPQHTPSLTVTSIQKGGISRITKL